MCARKKISVRVDIIMIKVMIPTEVYQNFLDSFRASHDERFLYSGSEPPKDGMTGLLVQLKPNNRADFYQYLSDICQSIGLELHKQDVS